MLFGYAYKMNKGIRNPIGYGAMLGFTGYVYSFAYFDRKMT